MKTIRPFRFWCQKVLPLVYDDSLSYYELLCKVVAYLNSLREDVAEIADLVEKLQRELDHYKDMIAVEVDRKLDEMAASGAFDLAYLAGAKVMSAPDLFASCDFSGLAAQINLDYQDEIGGMMCADFYELWDAIAEKDPFMLRTSLGTFDDFPLYVYKHSARLHEYTKNRGTGAETEYVYDERMADTYHRLKKFIVVGGMAKDYAGAILLFTKLFDAWLDGKYQGDYFLDNFDFYVLPIASPYAFDMDPTNNYVAPDYSVSMNGGMQSGDENYEAAPVCDAVEALIKNNAGVTTAVIDLHIFGWQVTAGGAFNIHGSPLGTLTRYNCSNNEDTYNAMFQAASYVATEIKTKLPALYNAGSADRSCSYITGRNIAGPVGVGNYYGCRGVGIEVPKFVGDTWEAAGTYYMSAGGNLIGLYEIYAGLMQMAGVLEKGSSRRIYYSLEDIGAPIWYPHGSFIDTSIAKMFAQLPNGSILETSLSATSMSRVDGLPDTYPAYVEGQTQGAGHIRIVKGPVSYGLGTIELTNLASQAIWVKKGYPDGSVAENWKVITLSADE